MTNKIKLNNKEIEYKIIERFTLKERIKILLGFHDKMNFECYSNGKKCRVHLSSEYVIMLGKVCPYGYVEVLE